MTNWLLSDNYWNHFLLIAPIILLKIIPGLWGEICPSLIRLMIERQFLLSVSFISPVLYLVPHRAKLFLNSLLTLLYHQPLLQRYIHLVHRIIIKKIDINRGKDITGLLDVTVIEGYIMEGYTSRKPFVFSMAVCSLTRIPTTENTWGVTALKQILTLLFITIGIFALVVPFIYSYVLFLNGFPRTIMTA